MAIWLTFDMGAGVQGLWTGFSLGYIPAIVLYVLLIFQIDWQAVIELTIF